MKNYRNLFHLFPVLAFVDQKW